MKIFITLSLLFSTFLLSCNKDYPYTLTVVNQESYSIKVGSGSFVGSVINANSSEDYSGSESNGEDYVVYIQSSYDSNGDGEHSTQYASPVSFDIEKDGSYYHVLGSGIVTKTK